MTKKTLRKDRIHLHGSHFEEVTNKVVRLIESEMRTRALQRGVRDEDQAANQKLCGGCFMQLALRIMFKLAKDNKFPLKNMSEMLLHISSGVKLMGEVGLDDEDIHVAWEKAGLHRAMEEEPEEAAVLN